MGRVCSHDAPSLLPAEPGKDRSEEQSKSSGKEKSNMKMESKRRPGVTLCPCLFDAETPTDQSEKKDLASEEKAEEDEDPDTEGEEEEEDLETEKKK
ncbi:uncharacterized protein LOC120403185 isoform X1 [Mauremys reevesii]|uniref:uncharacterized protein LOC120403185 isoform X1 n=1 Tax=Mauremys reevesii TaxID=260615 RepID=UPI00193EC29D|nr:uncharacterized protein LOC120403185 isoform X1 [Mauremys reevesii]